MHGTTFPQRVAHFIAQERLLDKERIHLVALSGGADSVALLLCLQELGYRIEAAHCNFQLRGAESLRDEAFCLALCKEKGIPIHVRRFDTRAYAKQYKLSIEMAARELRYHFFDELCRGRGLASVCVAHHQDDSFETTLLNLLRGTGIQGLTGIPIRNGNIVRPLLCVSRNETEQYLHDRLTAYITDSTNRETDFTRNKIRLEVMPLLETIQPSVRKTMWRTMQNLAETNKVVQAELARKRAEYVQPLAPPADGWMVETTHIGEEAFLHYLLSPYQFNPTQVRQLYHSIRHSESAEFHSAPYICTLSRGTLYVWQPTATEQPLTLPMTDGCCTMNDGRLLHVGYKTWHPSVPIPQSPLVACLDLATLTMPLTLRKWRQGDRFQPLGMGKGTQVISDFLTHIHATPPQRQGQYVVADADNRICWVVGKRIAHPHRITQQTEKVVQLTIGQAAGD